MILTRARLFETNDIAQFSWRKLSQFQNIEYTAQLISHLHNLDRQQLNNAKKQAEQIKYCLAQAKEYYDASRSVSLATKPVLLYYSVMSIALAESLLKQTADSRLSVLREKHNCHGLTLNVGDTPSINDSLENACSKLVAKAMGANGGQKGTFEVWRRSAREYPLGALIERRSKTDSGIIQEYQAVMLGRDSDIPYLPGKGVNLYECLRSLPYMNDALSMWGCRIDMVRAAVSLNINDDKRMINVVVHPCGEVELERFKSLVKMDADYVNGIGVNEFKGGVSFNLDYDRGGYFHLPYAISLNSKDTYFGCSGIDLCEFGNIYIAMHLLGNFARYYPEVWMKHIDANSPLANAAEDFCTNAMDRIPLLALSEFSREYHVAGAL